MPGASSVALALSLALLAVVLAGYVLGFRALVVRSDSMRPAFAAGDLLVTRLASPSAAGTGAVVTFSDPSRAGGLVTHRVVTVRREADELAFVTRGDANTGTEEWTIAADGRLGVLFTSVPKLGYATASLSSPASRLLTISLASALLGAIALRRIWRP